MLKLTKTSLTYDDTPILKDISIDLPNGSFNLLVGPSGSGKSTLMKVIAGMIPTLAGHVTINQQSLAGLPAYKRAGFVGLLFQDPDTQFAMSTPWEEIIFTLENLKVAPSEMTERANYALDFVNGSQFSHQSFDTLSGGEKQKVALAIMVAMQSKVLLLDEPFASIDITSRQEILKQLKKLQMNGVTILVTDHDYSGYADLVDDVFSFNQQHIQKINNLNAFFDQPSQVDYQFKQPQESQSVLKLNQFKLSVGSRTLIDIPFFALAHSGITLFSGSNGSGKSTLFNAITRLKPYQGQIMYLDQDISKIKLNTYAKKVALIFQSAEKQFMKMTVYEELALSQKHTQHPNLWTNEAIESALTTLHLDHLKDHIVYQLSGGQKKKLQVLLLLIIGTPVLLLDEPLAGLDSQSIITVLSLIKQTIVETQQRIIIISHQLNGVLDFIDYHIVLQNNMLTFTETLT